MRTEARISGSRIALEGITPREHLVEDHAEREDVAAMVCQQTLRLFRRHVRGGAQNDAGLCCVDTEGRRVREGGTSHGVPHGFRQPEIEHLDRTVRAELDVRRLQVTMDDSLLVGRLQGIDDLPRDRQRFL